MTLLNSPRIPPAKQNASATESAASVEGGNAVACRSGQGRRSLPDVALIFAASQRLSARVGTATTTAEIGASTISASTHRSSSAEEGASGPLNTAVKK